MKWWSFVVFCMMILAVGGCSIGPLVSIGEKRQEPNFIETPVIDVAPIVTVHKAPVEGAALRKQNEELKKENRKLETEIEQLEKEIKTLRATVESLEQQ